MRMSMLGFGGKFLTFMLSPNENKQDREWLLFGKHPHIQAVFWHGASLRAGSLTCVLLVLHMG